MSDIPEIDFTNEDTFKKAEEKLLEKEKFHFEEKAKKENVLKSNMIIEI